jgi:hypothetical protein
MDNAAAVKLETTAADRATSIPVELRGGGGFIGRFSPSRN